MWQNCDRQVRVSESKKLSNARWRTGRHGADGVDELTGVSSVLRRAGLVESKPRDEAGLSSCDDEGATSRRGDVAT